MPPHLHKRKGRKFWEIVEGRKRTSTGTTKRVLAEKALERYYLTGKGITVNSHEPISNYIPRYLEDSERVNKASTIDDKRRTLEFFLNYRGDFGPAAITSDHVLTYLKDRRGTLSKKPISAERWNSERQILGNFFRWLQKQKLIEYNPAEEVEQKKVVRSKIPKSLNRGEEKKLLKWCRKHDLELYRMAIVVGNTGIRVRELANLYCADVEGPTVNITAKEGWEPKDYEERAIPKSQLVTAVIKRQLRTSGSRWLFPRSDGERYGRGIDLRMCRAFKKAGLGSGGFHRVRHTFATRAMERGMDIETLRRLMGHADTKTLQKYLHVSPEHIKKQAALVKFGV